MKRSKQSNRFPSEIVRHWAQFIGTEPFKAVGKSRLQHLSWLVDFIQRPEFERDQPSQKDLENACREIMAFVVTEGQHYPVNPGWDWLWAAIREVCEGITRLASDDAWYFDPYRTWSDRKTQATERLYYGSRGELERYRNWSNPILTDEFIWCAREIVGIRRIRRCPVESCSRIFVPTKRQQYCSSQCSQRMRNQRFRQGHSTEERRERRRQSTLRKIAINNPALARHLAKRTRGKQIETPRS